MTRDGIEVECLWGIYRLLGGHVLDPVAGMGQPSRGRYQGASVSKPIGPSGTPWPGRQDIEVGA